MAHSNGLITAPVSFADVNAVLGTSITTLSSLCTSDKINIMAMYKPVPYSADTTSQLESNNTWKSTATWYKGNGNNYGVTPYSSSTFSNITSRTSGGTNGWAAVRPSGGSSAPYRLHDFLYYSHSNGRYSITCPSEIAAGGSPTISLVGQGTYGLSLTTVLGGKYFGAAFVSGSTVKCVKTASLNSTSVSFSSISLAQGVYTVVPFFCNATISQTTSLPSGLNYFTIPYALNVSTSVGGTAPTTAQVAIHYGGSLTTGPSATLLFAPAQGAIATALTISSSSIPSIRNINWASSLPSSCTLTKVGIDGNGSSTIYVKIVAAKHAASTDTTILTSTAVPSTGGQFNLTTSIKVDDYRAGDIHFYFSTGPIS